MSIEESSATPIEDVANHSTIFNLNQSQESIMETEDTTTVYNVFNVLQVNAGLVK